jgi:hypothetical protein
MLPALVVPSEAAPLVVTPPVVPLVPRPLELVPFIDPLVDIPGEDLSGAALPPRLPRTPVFIGALLSGAIEFGAPADMLLCDPTLLELSIPR